jgi:integrase
MASVYKPTYLSPIPPGAVRHKPKGRPAIVKWTDGKGKLHMRPIHVGADGVETDRMVCEQSRWWMKYRLPDGTIRREKGYRDMLATEQEAARREREAQQAAAGVLLVDPAYLSAPLTEHIAAFVADLERAGRAPKHYELLNTRLRTIAKACGWETLRQITPDSMSRYLATLRAAGKAPKTQNEYLAAAKGFCGWCVKARRLAGNPLASVTRTAKGEKTYQRRALTLDESKRLLAVAGPRRLVYLVAMRTGLRRAELRQLQWGDVYIDPCEKTPRIVLRAGTTKARRADVVDLHPDAVVELRAAKSDNAQPTDRVFASIPKMATFKADLARAGIPHIDKSGFVADFHGLRVTLNMELAKAGVDPSARMAIMRHTDIRLTMQTYADMRILNPARVVATLPSLRDDDQPDTGKAKLSKTGTDDVPVKEADSVIALNRGFQCPRVSITGRNGGNERAKTPINTGFLMEAAGIEPASRDVSAKVSTCVVV